MPVEVASLLFVCFAAALISGGIEVLVMDKLLNIPEFGAVGQYIPIVLVTIMEVLKIFLIFYSQRIKQAGKAYRATIAKGIHILLIGFSFLCTLIYTSNCLYHLDQVTDFRMEQKKALEAEYNEKIKEAQINNNNETAQLIAYETQLVENARNDYNNYEVIYSPKSEYKRSKKIKDQLNDRLTEAENQYRQNILTIKEAQDDKLEATKRELKDECEKIWKEKTDSFIIQSAGDNVYIRNTLMFFASLTGQKNGEYSRNVYNFFVILISFISAFILEAAIEVMQDVLSANDNDMEQIWGMENSINHELSNWGQNIAFRLLKAVVMLGVFVIASFCNNFSIDSNTMLTAYLSYFFAINLIRFDDNVNWKELFTDEKEKVKTEKVADHLQIQLGQVLMVIAVFLCVTAFALHTTTDLVPASLALTIGNVSGNLVFTRSSASVVSV